MDAGNFYLPYVIDARNPSRLVLGTDHVYETTNKGDNWRAIFDTNGVMVDAIALAERDPMTIYVSAGGQVSETTDDGANWNSGLFLDHFQDIAVDPTNPRVAYVVRDQFDNPNFTGHVWMTTDGGQSWANISGNLPALPANAIAVDPTAQPSVLYVGTDNGVYVSRDTGGTWTRFGSGLPNVRVTQIVLDSCNIPTVATYGRGMWQLVPQQSAAPTPRAREKIPLHSGRRAAPAAPSRTAVSVFAFQVPDGRHGSTPATAGNPVHGAHRPEITAVDDYFTDAGPAADRDGPGTAHLRLPPDDAGWLDLMRPDEGMASSGI